jgi:hypothetical protein
MDQGLLKRNPALTREQFSHHWFTAHAPLVVLFFLHSGITHYEQACPRPSPPPKSPKPPNPKRKNQKRKTQVSALDISRAASFPFPPSVNSSEALSQLTAPQIHGPLTATHPGEGEGDSNGNGNGNSNTALEITAYDGAAGMPAQEILDSPPPMPKWKEDYYREVILVDERRFLASEALAHIRRVGPGTVRGVRKVVIQEGKVLIEVPESVWAVWRGYEDRGKGGEGEGAK